MQPTENAGSAVRPYPVTVAVRAIWATNAISALLMVANYDGSDASVNTLLVNAIFLLIYVVVTAKVPMIAESGISKMADWGDVHEFLGDAIMWLAGLHAAAATVAGFLFLERRELGLRLPSYHFSLS